jgi:GDP-mannose 6-dehydrogenase
LASLGNEVLGVDTNEAKCKDVNAGLSIIDEPQLANLIRTAVAERLLVATADASPHIASCDMAIVCVGTPSAPDGSHNMGYVSEVTKQIAEMLPSDRETPLTVVYRSTFRPGTMEGLIAPIFANSLNGRSGLVELVYNPEFLRESVAVHDFLHPPKVVIGTCDASPCRNMDLLNSNIAAPVFYTRFREAEITKFVDNTFHAVKVAFANEIGRICRQIGVDTAKVHEIFVSDTKLNISPYYLRPGMAFGGSCLPKDVRALQHLGADVGANTHLVDSLLRSNEAHKHFLFELCMKGLGRRARVLLLGLAFKENTDDLRESPNVDLARKFLQHGVDLAIYDPHVVPKKLMGQNLGFAYSNLPSLSKLLISQPDAEREHFDLVVDTRGWAPQMSLHAARLVDLNTFEAICETSYEYC